MFRIARLLVLTIAACVLARAGHADLALLGTQQDVNVDESRWEFRPQVAGLPGGGFVVVWQAGFDTDAGPGAADVRLRLYDGVGVPLTGEITANSETADVQGAPAIAAISHFRTTSPRFIARRATTDLPAIVIVAG